MLKITLINPPQFSGYAQPPMGLALIAAVLERAGYPVNIIDANALNLHPASVVPLIEDCDVVGLTAMTPTIGAAIELSKSLKQQRPDLKIILGGAHATLLPRETMAAAPDIDFIIRGEGENTVIELLQAIEGNLTTESLSGISYRHDGDIVSNPVSDILIDMDSLPFPAYHLLPRHLYKPHPPHGLTSPFAAVITSRGCPYRCAYCSKPVFGSKFRARRPETVVAELSYLQENFGIKEFAFYDDVFTLDKKRVRAITAGIIEKKLDIYWTCEARVNLVDKEMLLQMKKSGCYAVAYGIESASPQILEMLHKDIAPEQVAEAIRLTREAGIQAIGYLMLGSPGETPDTIRQTIDLARQLQLDFAQFSITTPFPATELYEVYMQDGRDNIPWESFVYAGTDSQMTPVFESDGLSRDDLKYWTRRAYREFYLRPSYVWQRLRRCTSWAEIRLNLKGLVMLLKSIVPSAGT